MEPSTIPVAAAERVIHQVRRAVTARLLGLERAVDDLLIALMARGHILLEDVPGVGKTTLAKAFSDALGLSFRRIQCTPDLLPSDVVGGLVFHPQDSEFVVRKGPIFTNLLLVDEINRALPRTQSALLEAMAEDQVTIDGTPYPLPQPFLVIATENPLESQGVFPLPEAQLDRFLLKTSLGYPSADDDVAILSLHLELSDEVASPPPPAEFGSSVHPSAIARTEWPRTLAAGIASVRLSPAILRYISRVTRATRSQPDVQVGASPRAMVLLAKAARAAAVLAGRDFVTPDDVQRVAAGVLFHRTLWIGPAEGSEIDANAWMQQRVLQHVDVPLESGAP